MKRAACAAIVAAAVGTAFPVSAQDLPAGFPRPVFDWAVSMDLAVAVEANCPGFQVNDAAADAALGSAIAQAFPQGDSYIRWSARPGHAAEQARVREIASRTNYNRAQSEGFDLAKTDQLCAYGRAQMSSGSPAGRLLAGS